ncbi:MAG: hypothetical protein IJE46_06550 [Clostridia bacterium]|nr:hypothetical protein [Clostridia bacterium]
MKDSISSLKGENMKALVIRKIRGKIFGKNKTQSEIEKDDIKITILYARSAKKAKKIIKTFEYDCIFSCDFKELNTKTDSLMSVLPAKTLEKIASRHGVSLEETPIGVNVENLNQKNKEILSSLALCVRFMTVYTSLKDEEFEFLMEDAGISPVIINSNDFKEEITVILGEEFLIKSSASGKTYYDIKTELSKDFDEYFLPEENMIFSEYIKQSLNEQKNVKIRELMSK